MNSVLVAGITNV